MKLSKRLDCIATMIKKQANSDDQLADIGTDHGYLPCFLVEKNIVSKAYACDVAEGPLNSSKETIQMMQLQDRVIPLLGDGLAPIIEKPVTMISISGMGGFLMVDILKAHLAKLNQVHTLILQANICEYALREYLCTNGWEIVDEAIVKDLRHLYEVIVFKRTDKKIEYTMLDYCYGPILRKKQPLLFKQKWQREMTIKKRILDSIQDQTHPKFQETQNDIIEIEAILNDD
ncbi:tRNA (adenine(22)-N(1))-methyltransferase [Beduini massiliensis]|uniref:tRNA (adenine(22)-N(1))-methyltransferase n=1 Tax=Beduini massiliensis TaxID=1585974 RepID=UPI00059AA760|nr:class I SAM-dependent methyltransferase [Beduini massiliensis]